jgi:hypothetical protein
MMPADTTPRPPKRWNLWRAAFYGLLLQIFANWLTAFNGGKPYLPDQWSFEIIGGFVAMHIPGPILFAVIACGHNRRLKKLYPNQG